MKRYKYFIDYRKGSVHLRFNYGFNREDAGEFIKQFRKCNPDAKFRIARRKSAIVRKVLPKDYN